MRPRRLGQQPDSQRPGDRGRTAPRTRRSPDRTRQASVVPFSARIRASQAAPPSRRMTCRRRLCGRKNTVHLVDGSPMNLRLLLGCQHRQLEGNGHFSKPTDPGDRVGGVRGRQLVEKARLHVDDAEETVGLVEQLTHSTVTDFARLRGWSTSNPFACASSQANTCSGTVATSACKRVGTTGTEMTVSA